MSLPAQLQDAALIVRSRRPAFVTAGWVTLCVLSWAALLAQSVARPAPSALATLVVEWPSRRVVAETEAGVLDTPVLPGATAHVFALAAAAEAGLVSPSTTHLCRRIATADGRRFVCTHPELKRPLTAAEALAYACTDFFVDLAARLPRAALNTLRVRAGLDQVPDHVPWTSAVLGLAGPETSPRSLLTAVARTAGVGPDAAVSLRPSTRALVRAGLRGVPDYGPATAVEAGERPALVKAGTSPLAAGRALGLVLAFAPANAPPRAVLGGAPRGLGFDAPAIAATLLHAGAGRATAAASGAPAPAVATTTVAPPPAAAAATDAALRAASGTQVVRVGVALPRGGVRIDTLPIETYVSRVISGEGQPRAGAAAHEALAIVIRTFALANRHRHRAEGYDLCDSTHCQVMRDTLQVARGAALATAGRVLLDRGQPAFVYYSAHCGGIPALASEVWPGAVDYQPGEAHDDACADQPGWANELTTAQVERALRAAGASGRRLKDITVAEHTTSQRAGQLRVEGFEPATVSAYEFRMAVGRTLNWQLVRSTSFAVDRTDAGYRFSGVGYGHGVGLCVVGAGLRAARGESATQILRAYFGELAQSTVAATTMAGAGPRIGAVPPPQIGAVPPPQIGKLPPPQMGPPSSAPPPPGAAPSASAFVAGITLVLPSDLEGERAAVLELVRRARTDVAARAGIAEPAALTITVHPTPEAFGRATGQPWWGAASTVGAEIDVLPLTELRRRGTLESTLRQEVANVVLGKALAARPAWVRAGAALVFSAAEGAANAVPERVACPADVEVLRPVSGGAQREAFARAERCFRRQIAQGRTWRDVR